MLAMLEQALVAGVLVLFVRGERLQRRVGHGCIESNGAARPATGGGQTGAPRVSRHAVRFNRLRQTAEHHPEAAE
jgi:hypothetical protein